jgi:hypothetical protein
MKQPGKNLTLVRKIALLLISRGIYIKDACSDIHLLYENIS